MAYIVSDGDHSLRLDALRLEVRPHEELFEVEINGKKKIVSISRITPAHLSILIKGQSFNVEVERFETCVQVCVRGEVYCFNVTDEREVTSSTVEHEGGKKTISAPMPGLIVDIMVNEGDQVEAGQTLLVLEAMKMQNEISAPFSGTVLRIPVESGVSVNAGDDLVLIDS